MRKSHKILFFTLLFSSYIFSYIRPSIGGFFSNDGVGSVYAFRGISQCGIGSGYTFNSFNYPYPIAEGMWYVSENSFVTALIGIEYIIPILTSRILIN